MEIDLNPSDLDLRNLADIYEQTQKVRIAAENRVRAVAQGSDDEKKEVIASDSIVASLTVAEKYAEKAMAKVFLEHPCCEFMMGIPGIKNITACRVLGLIEDPRKFASFSKLRVFAGLCPGRNKRIKGQKTCYSTRLKRNLFIVFESMVKAAATTKNDKPNRFYEGIYRSWRSTYKARYGEGDHTACKKKKNGVDGQGGKFTRPDEEAQAWPDLRQHLASKNKMMDVFLFHVYEHWLTEIGEDVRPLYVHEVLGHHTKFERSDFTSLAKAKAKLPKSFYKKKQKKEAVAV